MSTPAGWYDDGSGRQRWWDGQNWSEHYADSTPDPFASPAPSALGAIAQEARQFTTPGPYAATTASAKPHVLAIIALVTAIVGFVFACVPGALIVGWVLLPIAFVLSIVALFLRGKKWPAIVGLVVAVVGTVVGFVVFFVIIANAARDAFKDLPTAPISSPTPGSTQAAGSSVSPEDAGKYQVEIGDATKGTDFEGNPALIVNFTFTNHSSEDTSFMFAVSAKAFQDGVELEDAIVTDDSVDSASVLKDIKPGASIVVQRAYKLTGTSDVSVEVKKFSPFDDAQIASKTFTVG